MAQEWGDSGPKIPQIVSRDSLEFSVYGNADSQTTMRTLRLGK